MDPIVKHYENAQAAYCHRYVMEYRKNANGNFDVYCTQHPKDPHRKDEFYTHISEKNGLLCRNVPMRSFEQAEAFAYYWMSNYSIYLNTGHFPNKGGKVNVPDR